LKNGSDAAVTVNISVISGGMKMSFAEVLASFPEGSQTASGMAKFFRLDVFIGKFY